MASFVSSLFSRDPTTSFAFEISREANFVLPNGIQMLDTARKVWDCSQANSQSWMDLAKCVSKIRILKHPNMLAYLDSLETGLKFLHSEVKLSHNSIVRSIFVSQCGDWKIGGFVCSSEFRTFPEIRFTNIAPSSSREDLGQLLQIIWNIFNSGWDVDASSERRKKPGSVPKNWLKFCSRLAKSQTQSDAASLIALGKEPGGIFKSKFMDVLMFLEEYNFKEPREKQNFFGTLNEHIELFPEDIAQYKILPKLIQAFSHGEASAAMLPPLLHIGSQLTETQYQIKVVPTLIHLFASTDRRVRVSLLDRLPQLLPHLSEKIVNDKIFGPLVTGFLDTNPAIREATIKAMVPLAEKLNSNNLDIELMRHFARLQSKDDEPGIRTNTTICLGKIAACLQPGNRQKILISAFTRGMKVVQIVEVREQAFKATRCFLEKLQKASDDPKSIPELESSVNSAAGGKISQKGEVNQWASWALGAISGKFYKSPSPGGEKSTPSATENATNSEPTRAKESILRNAPMEQIDANDQKSTDIDGWGDMDDDFCDEKSPENDKMIETISGNIPSDDGWGDVDIPDETDGWGSNEDETWGDIDGPPLEPPQPKMAPHKEKINAKPGGSKITGQKSSALKLAAGQKLAKSKAQTAENEPDLDDLLGENLTFGKLPKKVPAQSESQQTHSTDGWQDSIDGWDDSQMPEVKQNVTKKKAESQQKKPSSGPMKLKTSKKKLEDDPFADW